MDQGLYVWMVKHLIKFKNSFFISENGDIFGSWAEDIPSVFRAEKWDLQGHIHAVPSAPAAFIYFFGAGEDAKPLVRLAKETGFFTTVCDWREALCTPLSFPEADSCIVGFPREVMPCLDITERDFCGDYDASFQTRSRNSNTSLTENMPLFGDPRI
ncbi:hypothetical protein GCM10020331_036570 [Ectobacillus funiculus]